MTLSLDLALLPSTEIVTLPAGTPASAGQVLAGAMPDANGFVQLSWVAPTAAPAGTATVPAATAEGQFLVSGAAAASYAWQPLPLDYGTY